MNRKEVIDKIKESKGIVKKFHSRNETFELEVDGKRYFVSREWIEDDLGDDFVKDLIEKLK